MQVEGKITERKEIMDARELNSRVRYAGMERDARTILLKDNLATVEDVAIMASLDVFDRLLEKYEVIMCEQEDILLIDKKKMEEFNKMAVYLSR